MSLPFYPGEQVRCPMRRADGTLCRRNMDILVGPQTVLHLREVHFPQLEPGEVVYHCPRCRNMLGMRQQVAEAVRIS